MKRNIFKVKLFLTITFLVISYFFLVNYALDITKDYSLERTELTLKNSSKTDSVLTYLTIGDDNNFITDVYGVFGIKQHGLQGYFYAKKDSLYTYKFDKKGISGNISFGTPPLNCPTEKWKNGVNLYEITLNNFGTVSKAQETSDISCVGGVNALGKIKFSDPNWIAGGKRVDSASNLAINNNFSRVGVYPYLCSGCISISNPPNCTKKLNPSTPQKNHICNMSRNASKSGGTVSIEFLGYTD